MRLDAKTIRLPSATKRGRRAKALVQTILSAAHLYSDGRIEAMSAVFAFRDSGKRYNAR